MSNQVFFVSLLKIYCIFERKCKILTPDYNMIAWYSFSKCIRGTKDEINILGTEISIYHWDCSDSKRNDKYTKYDIKINVNEFKQY